MQVLGICNWDSFYLFFSMLLPLTKILIRRHNRNLRSLKRDSLISYAKIFHVLLRPKLAKKKSSLKISLLRIRDLSFSRHVYTLEKPLRILVFRPFFVLKNPSKIGYKLANQTENNITSYSMHFYNNIMSIHLSLNVVNYLVSQQVLDTHC